MGDSRSHEKRVSASSEALLGRVRSFLATLPPELLKSPLIVAVSGGADSLCLLHAMHSLAPERNLRLHVAHLHHGQREEGDADADFVEAVAQALGWPYERGREDVPAIARTERLSLEMAGRAARYRFFTRLAVEIGAKAVATAHQADDQAETVLMRALRGAGARGLRGIPPVGPMPESDGRVKVIRPLLTTSRAEIVQYLEDHRLEPRLDATNLDLRLQRNRVRQELLPLAEEIIPGSSRGLLRLSREAEEDEAILGRWAEEAWGRCSTLEVGRIRLHLPLLPPETGLRRRVLRRSVEALLPATNDFPEAAIDRLLEMISAPLSSPWPRRVSLPRGVTALRSEGELQLFLPTPERDEGYCWEVQLPGEIDVPETGWTLLVEEVDPETLASFPARHSWEAVLDRDRLTAPFFVRTRQPGDRIRVLGSGGTRNLQELFREAGIPVVARCRWPLLCDSEKICWVPGLALHNAVKITGSTRNALRLRMLSSTEEGAEVGLNEGIPTGP